MGCKEATISGLQSEQPVLTGVLVENETANNIRFFLLPEFGTGLLTAPDNASVVVRDQQGVQWELSAESEGVYHFPDASLIFESGKEYFVEANHGKGKLTVQVSLPESFLLLTLSNTEYTLQPDNPGASAFHFSWEDNEEYSYVITLEPLANDPIPSVFYPNHDFQNQFQLPILEGQAILRASYFNYVGPHQVTIYAIDKAYESVFFFNPVADIRSYLNSGPDNVIGGSGFVTGVSKVSFIIEILE